MPIQAHNFTCLDPTTKTACSVYQTHNLIDTSTRHAARVRKLNTLHPQPRCLPQSFTYSPSTTETSAYTDPARPWQNPSTTHHQRERLSIRQKTLTKQPSARRTFLQNSQRTQNKKYRSKARTIIASEMRLQKSPLWFLHQFYGVTFCLMLGVSNK